MNERRQTRPLAMLAIAASVLLHATVATADDRRLQSLHRSHFYEAGGQVMDADLYAPPTLSQQYHAGHAECQSRFARPSNTPAYQGGYVGGGSPWWKWSRPRADDEGTWGWDYVGTCVPRRVWLHWWCPPRHQGGAGSYEPDGPKLKHE